MMKYRQSETSVSPPLPLVREKKYKFGVGIAILILIGFSVLLLFRDPPAAQRYINRQPSLAPHSARRSEGIPIPINRTAFGTTWPLSVDSGYVYCWAGEILFQTDAGRWYTFDTQPTLDGIPPISTLQSREYILIGAKKNIQPLYDQVVKICTR